MKHIYLLIALTITVTASAQIPAGYYNNATGSGYVLKTQLRDIITNGHNGKSYDNLFTDPAAYKSTDTDDFYENDGSVMDMYSEEPTDEDPYNYSYYANDKCGNYGAESDCFNGEHLMPQSVYNSAMPMVGDIHQVIPTDGYVNGGRSNFPFGIVNSPTKIYDNGSKKGNNSIAGYSGPAFEPINEFKGDIARCMLYVAVRYQNNVSSWDHAMLNGTSDQVYEDWFIALLLDWHNGDAVNQREINRNNASYDYQGNRNPFIDHPEWANLIWDPTPDTEAPTNPTNLVASNPTSNSIDLTWTAASDNVAVSSYDVFVDSDYAYTSTSPSLTATGLNPETTYCFTVFANDAYGNTSTISNESCETTLEAGVPGSDCIAETFENIGNASGSYSDRTWTGDNGGQWYATEARTDLELNGKAITIDGRSTTNGVLTSPVVSGGIANLTVTTQRNYSGGSGSLSLYVNGDLKGAIPYDGTVQTTTISNINIEGSVSIVITEDTSGGDRVAIDDLSWTCYSELGIEDQSINTVKVYPNPTKGNLNINLKYASDTQIDIYNILGKRVFSKTIQESENIDINKLSAGIYILKLTQGNSSVSKKLIKE